MATNQEKQQRIQQQRENLKRRLEVHFNRGETKEAQQLVEKLVSQGHKSHVIWALQQIKHPDAQKMLKRLAPQPKGGTSRLPIVIGGLVLVLVFGVVIGGLILSRINQPVGDAGSQESALNVAMGPTVTLSLPNAPGQVITFSLPSGWASMPRGTQEVAFASTQEVLSRSGALDPNAFDGRLTLMSKQDDPMVTGSGAQDTSSFLTYLVTTLNLATPTRETLGNLSAEMASGTTNDPRGGQPISGSIVVGQIESYYVVITLLSSMENSQTAAQTLRQLTTSLQLQNAGSQQVAAQPTNASDGEPTVGTANLSQDIPDQIPVVARNSEWQSVARDFDGVTMVLVPPGCFNMGDDTEDYDDEYPVHQQCINTPFWIDRTEVTNAQFALFGGLATRPGKLTGDNYPRDSVTWDEAVNFCAVRGSRLPTEAEWEYAARGPDSLVYPWGNEFRSANIIWNTGQAGEVGTRPEGVSWVGAFDMIANVAEWTSSLPSNYPYDANDGREVMTADSSRTRILRGGYWGSLASTLLIAAERTAENGSGASNLSFGFSLDGSTYGFRCVRSMDSEGIAISALPTSVSTLDISPTPTETVPATQNSVNVTDAPQFAYFGEGGLTIVNVDGSNPRVLLQGANSNNTINPSWSPDGTQIVFYDGNAWDIFVIDVASAQLQRITNTPNDWEYWPSLSPDGTRIVFAGSGFDNEVFTMDLNGGNVHNVSNTPDLAINFPVWSPDGATIAFLGTVDTDPSPATFNGGLSDIYIMNVDGSNVRNVTNTPDFNETTPLSFSPDGTRITYRVIDPAGYSDVYIANSDGSVQRNLTSDPSIGSYPDSYAWSPDGVWIAISSGDGRHDIYLVDPDGESMRNLTNTTVLSETIPIWSPDGTQIAYTDYDNIYLIESDGTNPRVIVSGTNGGLVSWRPGS